MLVRTSRSKPASSKSWKLFIVLVSSLLLIEQIGATELQLPRRTKRSDYEDEDYDEHNDSSFPGESESEENNNMEVQSAVHEDHTAHRGNDDEHEHDDLPSPNEQDDDDLTWGDSEEDNADEDSKMHHHPIHHDHHGHHAHHSPPAAAGPRSLNVSSPNESQQKGSVGILKGSDKYETTSGSHSSHDHHHHGHQHHNNHDDHMDASNLPSDSKSLSNEGVAGKENTLSASNDLEKEGNANFHIWVGAGLVALLIAIAIAIMIVLNNVRKRKYGRVSSA